MKKSNKLPYVHTVLSLLFVSASISACSSGFDSAQSAWSNQYPDMDEIKGMVYIESPKVGTLLQLRGLAGKGMLTIRQDEAESCVSVPVRLAAGDFGGSNIGVRPSGAIRLLIYSSEVANKLLSGEEIISEKYDVTELSDFRHGDIKIEYGLNISYGFVLNPGEWFWSSLFGLDQKIGPCNGA
jgi:hypothetical protein